MITRTIYILITLFVYNLIWPPLCEDGISDTRGFSATGRLFYGLFALLRSCVHHVTCDVCIRV